MKTLPKSILILTLAIGWNWSSGQVITSEIEVMENTPTILKSNGTERLRVDDAGAKITGDLEVSGRYYFGGDDRSSYIQHYIAILCSKIIELFKRDVLIVA